MNRIRSGFTLMEIMVVIIVIAVLASVAGPMIGSITDQGRASATKSKLSALKSALISYKNDVGRFPFQGSTTAASYVSLNYNNANASMLGSNMETNVLAFNETDTNVEVKNYQRRWKGPYMDANPEDFMLDGWGNRIDYFASEYNIYLRSPGINGGAEAVKDALDPANQEQGLADDILMSVAKVRKKFDS